MLQTPSRTSTSHRQEYLHPQSNTRATTANSTLSTSTSATTCSSASTTSSAMTSRSNINNERPRETNYTTTYSDSHSARNTVHNPPVSNHEYMANAHPNWPGVNRQHRNQSDDVFKFGNGLGYRDERERYITDVAAMESARTRHEKHEKQVRYAIRRQYIQEIETHRWQKMAHDHEKEQQKLDYKKDHYRANVSGAAYNPITLSYLPTEDGEKLKKRDVDIMYNAAKKSLHNHIRGSTFNPITGQDISAPSPGARRNVSIDATKQATESLLNQKVDGLEVTANMLVQRVEDWKKRKEGIKRTD